MTHLPAGTVHAVLPKDMQTALGSSDTLSATWNDITPLARNEWICLVTSTQSAQTRARRMKRMTDQLGRGQRRPCCWQGCPHREKNGKP